jgi:hypothetical protein
MTLIQGQSNKFLENAHQWIYLLYKNTVKQDNYDKFSKIPNRHKKIAISRCYHQFFSLSVNSLNPSDGKNALSSGTGSPFVRGTKVDRKIQETFGDIRS